MSEELTHDEIASKFLESGSLNFDAMGRFVTELGPELTVRDKGIHGVVFGKYNVLACMLTAHDLVNLVGNLGGARQVAAEMNIDRPQ